MGVPRSGGCLARIVTAIPCFASSTATQPPINPVPPTIKAFIEMFPLSVLQKRTCRSDHAPEAKSVNGLKTNSHSGLTSKSARVTVQWPHILLDDQLRQNPNTHCAWPIRNLLRNETG